MKKSVQRTFLPALTSRPVYVIGYVHDPAAFFQELGREFVFQVESVPNQWYLTQGICPVEFVSGAEVGYTRAEQEVRKPGEQFVRD